MIVIVRNWNRGLLDMFEAVMEWMMNLIYNLITLSPYDFSSYAYNLSQNIGTGLVNFAIPIMIVLWGIDFIGGSLDFQASERSMHSMVKLIIKLGFGFVFTYASFYLVMGLFQTFGGILTFASGTDLSSQIDFSQFTQETRAMIDARSGFFNTYDMGNTENILLFVFLVFTFLSFFGMFLGMILVPVSIFVELFIYAAFSPIPIATLFTGRQEIGISFIKLVASVCLRGPVVLFGISLALNIMSTPIFQMTGFTITGFWAFLMPVASISISIMILQKCVKGAETFARQLVGA